MSKDFDVCEYISELALKSMLYEVSTTPKPGLVDRNNPGAHNDMDFFSFMASSGALAYTFYKCALAGLKFQGVDIKGLLHELRPIGIEGEEKMFRATKGINTHKGLIFSLGLIAAAAGLYYRETKSLPMNAGDICNRIKEMTEGISNKELGNTQEATALTYGEKLFRKYGIKGIRGEVEAGFPTVRCYGLPILRDLMKQNRNINDSLVQVLFHLMTVTEDSNVLGRHDWEALDYVKTTATEVLEMGGMFTERGKNKIIEIDKEFIKKNISPGGSADLLAVTIMFYLLETSDEALVPLD
ncbi:triphosphoribosyl-dephospho-CoA synthase CitG [Natronincola ferrireducens]|uniref:Probable 2-(5''-triphosphoribosyl)-3'-dephosphocoenzyme-A synthase n=1 Tax=Natronincola ferrireducens TaxID=393762 RepID=A0A1G8Y3D1_9FIRM|nr:triphosphoribosyl-dephospho-CoA synthase CitG [Natronincola ferrireducens]SDJ97332.1 triphosphoribosyl-dephospho-CoA synthase [Natronincola ferrireducens]